MTGPIEIERKVMLETRRQRAPTMPKLKTGKQYKYEGKR